MKTHSLIQFVMVACLWLSGTLASHAQLSDSEWKTYERKSEAQLKEYKEQNPYLPFYQYEIKKIEFTVETFIASSFATASDMYASSLYEVQSYDKLLNQYYKRLMSKMTPEQKEELRNVQRLWLKFYEKNTQSCAKMERIVNKDTGTLRFPVEMEGKANTLKYRVMELGWMISYLKY